MLNNVVGLLGGAAPEVGDYESIQTYTVGSGGQASITFSSIPSTYKHLQIRYIAATSTVNQNLQYTFNSDSSAVYANHRLLGDGSVVVADAATGNGFMSIGRSGQNSTSFAAGVFDLLDYKDTNKFKTARTLYGTDGNGSGQVFFASGLWRSTAAVSTVTIVPASSNFAQYTNFALYGIK
jgi:hypothetical protein